MAKEFICNTDWTGVAIDMRRISDARISLHNFKSYGKNYKCSQCNLIVVNHDSDDYSLSVNIQTGEKKLGKQLFRSIGPSLRPTIKR